MENPQAPNAGEVTTPLSPEQLIELANATNQQTDEPPGADTETDIVDTPPPAAEPAEPAAPVAEIKPEVDIAKLREQVFAELSPLARRVNEIITTGGDLAMVEKIIAVSKVDLSAISNADAVTIYYQSKYPGDSPAKLAARMLNDGIDTTQLQSEDEVTRFRAEIALEKVADVAKEYIREQQKISAAPSASAAVEAQKALQLEADKWGHVLGSVKTFGAFSADVQLPGDKTERVGYTVPGDSVDAIRKAVAADLAKSNTPMTQEGLLQAQKMFNSYAMALHGPEIIAAAISAAEARVRKEIAQGEAGPPPGQPRHSDPKDGGKKAPSKWIA